MADEKTITGHEERGFPTGMSSPEASPIPGVDKSLEQFGIEKPTPPATDDKKGKADPGNEAPITEPKVKDVKVIDITDQVMHRSEPPVPGDGSKLVNDTTSEKATSSKVKTSPGTRSLQTDKPKVEAEKPGRSDRPGKGRPLKADKDAPKPDKKQRDKVSQSDKGKDAPE